MISKFDASTALLLIDVQKGVNDTAYYGGPTGRRNNPEAEGSIISILIKWRASGRKVAFTKHDSIEEKSPLKPSLESGQRLEGMETAEGDIVVEKIGEQWIYRHVAGLGAAPRGHSAPCRGGLFHQLLR